MKHGQTVLFYATKQNKTWANNFVLQNETPKYHPIIGQNEILTKFGKAETKKNLGKLFCSTKRNKTIRKSTIKSCNNFIHRLEVSLELQKLGAICPVTPKIKIKATLSIFGLIYLVFVTYTLFRNIFSNRIE